jgi:hypothetical protein
MLVDSGAIYSVVPAPLLRRLRIRPLRGKEEFRLADGSKIERRKGIALFRYSGREGGADVIFGEPGDSTLVGALTLEALGLSLDPLRRELKPLPMILGGWRPRARAAARSGHATRRREGRLRGRFSCRPRSRSLIVDDFGIVGPGAS